MAASNEPARMYFDDDASLSVIDKAVVGVIGYGNQGEAQAQNLRDSGIHVIVGNRHDDYRSRAQEAGFEVSDIAEAAARASVLLLLIPDEVQPEVFSSQIAPHLNSGDTLVLASGYNWYYQLLEVPDGVDVVMVAPRMIGAAVRSRFEARQGYPCFVSAEHDASGQAMQTALAIARGIGATAGGAIESSAREETALDLFAEQAIWPAVMNVLSRAYDVLHEAGFGDEAILYEMYLSGEPAEIFTRVASQGLFAQLQLHSRTSQFGQTTGYDKFAQTADADADRMRQVLHQDILDGAFAKRWEAASAEQDDALVPLRQQLLDSPIGQAERAVRERTAGLLESE